MNPQDTDALRPADTDALADIDDIDEPIWSDGYSAGWFRGFEDGMAERSGLAALIVGISAGLIAGVLLTLLVGSAMTPRSSAGSTVPTPGDVSRVALAGDASGLPTTAGPRPSLPAVAWGAPSGTPAARSLVDTAASMPAPDGLP